MKAKSIKGKNAAEIKTALDTSMADGFTPTVAIVLLEADIPHEEVCSVLSQKSIQVFGASTGSNFTDGEIESGSIIIMLMEINPDYFQIKLATSEKRSTKETAEEIGKAGLAAFSKPVKPNAMIAKFLLLATKTI